MEHSAQGKRSDTLGSPCWSSRALKGQKHYNVYRSHRTAIIANILTSASCYKHLRKYLLPPKTHQWERHLPRQGKESTTPFYPDAGRIAPTSASVLCQRYLPALSASVLCSSFELKPDERLYSSLQLSLPQPLAADSNSTPSWASAFEVLAVIEPSRMCCSMQSCITVPSGRIYVFFIVCLYIIKACVTSLPPSGRSQCTHP